MSRGPGDEIFWQRWSRRKREAATRDALASTPVIIPPASPAPEPPVPASSQPQPKSAADTETAPLATPTANAAAAHAAPPSLSLQNVADFAPGSDMRALFQSDVPAAVRTQALRRLWVSDPAFNVPDPLDIHNLDYNAPASMLTSAAAAVWRQTITPQATVPQVPSPEPGNPAVPTATPAVRTAPPRNAAPCLSENPDTHARPETPDAPDGLDAPDTSASPQAHVEPCGASRCPASLP